MAHVDEQLVRVPANAGLTVAIVGGGYAGMAAAVTLAQAGVRCSVFESAKVLGGRARRIEYRGEILDNGQHILAGAYTELLRMMRLVGVPDTALKRVPLRLSIAPNFLLSAPRTALLPANLYLALTLLRTKGLTLSDKIAAVRFLLTLKRANFRIDTAKTVAQLLTQTAQPQNLIDNLWQPLTISALNTPLSSASAQVFANVIRDSLASTCDASDLLLPRVDLSALFPEPAAAWITHRGSKVHMGLRVQRIDSNADGYTVISENGSQQFDATILAVGPHQFAGLMSGISAPDLHYEPIVTVYFKFDRRVRIGEEMSGQRHGLAQWFFDRQALNFPNHDDNTIRNASEGLIAAVISASGPHDSLPQEELADRIQAELAAHIPDCPKPVWRKVITEKYATFACTPEIRRLPSITSYPGVFLAGDHIACDYPATLEGAVRNGIRAARESINYLRPSPTESIK